MSLVSGRIRFKGYTKHPQNTGFPTMFRALFTAVVLLASVAPVLAQPVSARQLGSAQFREVMHINQNVELDGSAVMSARVGPLTTSTKGFGINKNVTVLPDSPVKPLPAVAVSNPVGRMQALATSAQWANGHINSLRSDVARYAQKTGLSSVVFTYTQEINVVAVNEEGVSSTKRQAIAFVVSFDATGRPLYGAPKIVDPEPTILEAIYTPMRAAEGLPTNWAYPDRGTLKYRVLKKDLSPLTNFKSLQLAGEFDDDRSPTDPDAGLRCLMDRRNPGCSGPTDIRALLDETGSSFGIVDYVRQLEPDYEGESDTPDGVLQGRGALSYDKRIYQCDAYVNEGHWGYVLTMRAERYLAEPAEPLLRYKLAQQFGGKTISPTEKFVKSVPISDLNGRNPDDLLISPHPNDNSLWNKSDPEVAKLVIYTAPLRAQGGDAELPMSSPTGLGYTAAKVSDGLFEYLWGFPYPQYDNYWPTGLYDHALDFTLSDDPAKMEEFSLLFTTFDDWLRLRINGTDVYFGGGRPNMNALEYSRPGALYSECRYESSRNNWSCAVTRTGAVSAGPPSSTCDVLPYETDNPAVANWKCWDVSHAYCSYEMEGGDSTRGGWSCSESLCPAGWVQFRVPSGNDRIVDYCEIRDTGHQQFDFGGADVRHLLRKGPNRIEARIVVVNGGDFSLRFRTAACGAKSGVDRGPVPAVPPGAGESGVDTKIRDKAKN